MAGNSAAMADGLSVLSRFFINDGTLGETLLRVAELACRVSPADMAGITMLVEGKTATGVFTDPQAPGSVPGRISQPAGLPDRLHRR
jgi:hypothetical protein